MKYRRLGRTGLGVSPLTLGTMAFGPPTEPAAAAQLVHTAIELGINTIDTANCYDGPQRGDVIHGHAESMLGEILSSGLRDDVVLITKVGVPLRPGPQHRGLSPSHIDRELERSLGRLKTDCVDVYMLHWPDAFADIDEVLLTLERAVLAGKIRHFGISNHQAWQVCEYLWAADRRNRPMASVSEIPLSILDRRYENDLPFYERQSIGVLAYQPLKGGILSERRLKAAPDGAQEEMLAAGWELPVSMEIKSVLTELCDLARETGLTLSEMAIAWTATQTAVASVIVGARSVEQLRSAVKAAELRLPADVLTTIDRLVPPPPKPIPRFER